MPVRKHPVATPPANTNGVSDPAGSIPLDLALIQRLRYSYARVREHDLRFAEIFYESLFRAAPDLRPLFRSAPEAQAAKLVASLDMVVENLARTDANAAMLAALGRRHTEYGARPEHYAVVTDLLVDAMARVLGPSADAGILAEWRTAIGLVGRQMIAGAQSTGPVRPGTAGHGPPLSPENDPGITGGPP